MLYTARQILELQNVQHTLVATIAEWFRLCLPFWDPKFESQAHHLGLFQITYISLIEFLTAFWYLNEKMTKINEAGFGPHFILKNSPIP